MIVRIVTCHHKHNSLQISFTLKYNEGGSLTYESTEYKFGNTNLFKFQIEAPNGYRQDSWFVMSLKVKFYKQLDDKNAYALKLYYNSAVHHIPCDDQDTNIWRMILTDRMWSNPDTIINLNVQMYTDVGNPLAMLHDDAESDFELRGEDGSIRVHKAVLGLYSPVLKTMLRGEWRETAEGRVEAPGVSQQTLQQLKDYMYLRKIPDTADVEQLMHLAKYYEMQELWQICMEKYMQTVSAENVWDVLELLLKDKSNEMLIRFVESFNEKKIAELVNKLAELKVGDDK